MDYIIVTFYSESRGSTELKIPVFVKIEELLTMLSESLYIHIGPENKLQAEPIGRILDNNKTLEEEGVGHGALLTLI